jgi:hypothetical protein
MTVNTTGTEEEKGQPGECVPRIQNRSTQSDYRESETQTTPWAPPVFTHCTPTPEVLTLTDFSWGVYNLKSFPFHCIIIIKSVMDRNHHLKTSFQANPSEVVTEVVQTVPD